MEAISNTNLFTDLTEGEAAALNGGYRCYIVWQLRCYTSWGRRICNYIAVRICR